MLDPATRFAVLAVGGLGALALLVNGVFAGWSVVALCGAAVVQAAGSGLAWRALRRGYPHPALGWCNVVTLLRMVLASALLVPLAAPTQVGWSVFAIASVALALDGVDGWLARRGRLVSAFGARFDMEVDAGLALVLALNGAVHGGAGWMVVMLGLPRYVFWAAGFVLPWLGGDLPERFSRKAVCVIQIGVLIAVQAPIVPAPLAHLLVSLAAGGLAWSFGRDILWLWQRRA